MTTAKQERMQTEIIQCSKRLFEQHGYSNTSIRMIAQQMGFKTQASFYSYFESKDKMTALILRKGSKKVQQYIESLNINDVSAVHKLLLEDLIIIEILRDDFNRRFYKEAQGAQDYKTFTEQIPGYTKKLYDNISKEVVDITFEELQLNLFAYVKCVCGIFEAIDQEQTNVSYDSATKRLPYIFLELMGIDKQDRQRIIAETVEIYRRIDPHDLTYLYFFDS